MSKSTDPEVAEIDWVQEIHLRMLEGILGAVGASNLNATLWELLAQTASMVSWLREDGFTTDDIVIILEALEQEADIPQESR